jgi:5'-nucleotidase
MSSGSAVKPLILITNDDGVFSPGLQAVAEAVVVLGDLLIAAPRIQQTGMSRALHGGEDSGIIEETTIQVKGSPHRAYGIHAPPALAVAHAVFELAPRLPDLCISGINYGENIGMTISASGTIGAALEAAMAGIPALAISRGAPLTYHRANKYKELDWTVARTVTRLMTEKVLQFGLPPHIDLLNVNVPNSATAHTEIRPTIQSHQRHIYFTRPERRDFARPFVLPLKDTVDPQTLEPNSDIQAFLIDNVISVSPLTAYLTAPTELSNLLRYVGQ